MDDDKLSGILDKLHRIAPSFYLPPQIAELYENPEKKIFGSSGIEWFFEGEESKFILPANGFSEFGPPFFPMRIGTDGSRAWMNGVIRHRESAYEIKAGTPAIIKIPEGFRPPREMILKLVIGTGFFGQQCYAVIEPSGLFYLYPFGGSGQELNLNSYVLLDELNWPLT